MGIPARMPAAVVPGAAVVDDRAAGGKDGRMVHRAHNFHVVGMWDVG